MPSVLYSRLPVLPQMYIIPVSYTHLDVYKRQIERLLKQQELNFQPQDVQGLYLNLQYDGQNITCVTGTSIRLFTLDKSLEEAWDQMVQRFFLKKEISAEFL